MNYCPHADEVIDYTLHRLTGKKKSAFEAHLEFCSLCQRELAIEMAVGNELSVELQPGFIEQRIIERLDVYRQRDMRSFWLYSYRIVVLGIAAAIACFVLLPYVLRFPINSLPALSKQTAALADFFGGLAPVNPILLVIGCGYIALIASSIYALGHVRR